MSDVNMRRAEMTAYVAEKANQVEGEFGATYTSVPNGVRPVMWLDISY